MSNNNHGQLLEILLIIKNMTKTDFSTAMGTDRNNFPNIYKKPRLKTETIEAICHVLNVNKSYFEKDLNSIISQADPTPLSELKSLYERLLSEKDERIKLLAEKGE